MSKSSKNTCILVVDDDPTCREMIGVILSPLGCSLVKAANGEEAIILLENSPEIDLIMLDLNMPGIDGFETLQWIRNNDSHRNTPVMIITSERDKLVTTLRMGANDFVTKPFNPDEIQLRVTNLLHLRWIADSATRTKHEFLSNMSHEIRTPLNGIIGILQLMFMTNLTDEQREYLELADLSANRLQELLTNVLNISRLETERTTVTPSSFCLRDCIDNVFGLVTLKLSGKGLSTRIDIDHGFPELIVADNMLLLQVLAHVIGNAVKFTEHGGITVKARLENRVDNTGTVHMEVRDTGVGIPAEALASIFEAFNQSDNSLTRRFEGGGLGLSISRKLIESMGGNIHAESNPDHGTVIHIVFPVTFPHDEPVEPVSEPSGQNRQGLEIMIAEDNVINSRYVVKLLQMAGHTVTSVKNGKEALQAWENKHFDIILLDIEMPVMSGNMVLKMIRQREKGLERQTPVIAVTAYAMKGDREYFLAEGFNGYVEKPFRGDVLNEEINRCLNSGS